MSKITVGTGVQEHTIDATERHLEEVALVRVLRVEELKQVQHELLVNVPFREVRVDIRELDAPEDQLVHDLQM